MARLCFRRISCPVTTLWRVSSDGGKAEPITLLVEGEQVHTLASNPAGRKGGAVHQQCRARRLQQRPDRGAVAAERPAKGRPPRRLSWGYLSSGHLVYVHNGTLFAASFDLDRLEMTSEPVPALPGVASNAVSGGAQFSFSNGGALVYSLDGPRASAVRCISWITKARPRRCAPRG